MPSLCSSRLMIIVGFFEDGVFDGESSRLYRKKESPLAPFPFSSLRARTRAIVAQPLVIKRLTPFKNHFPSASCVAFRLTDCKSLPASGSVKTIEESHSPEQSFGR